MVQRTCGEIKYIYFQQQTRGMCGGSNVNGSVGHQSLLAWCVDDGGPLCRQTSLSTRETTKIEEITFQHEEKEANGERNEEKYTNTQAQKSSRAQLETAIKQDDSKTFFYTNGHFIIQLCSGHFFYYERPLKLRLYPSLCRRTLTPRPALYDTHIRGDIQPIQWFRNGVLLFSTRI